MIIQKQFEKAGWGFPSPLKLNFLRNTDVPEGKSGIIPAGMITSPFSGLGGTITAKDGALGIILPEYPVPDEKFGEIVLSAVDGVEREFTRNGGRASEFTNLAFMIDIGQSSWVTQRVNDIRNTFFESDNSDLSPPTVSLTWDDEQAVWDDFYCVYNKLRHVEAFVKGTPNGHPMWDGLDILS